ATSEDGEPLNGDARNISAGGLCVELPSGERLADEFEVKLFLPDRAKPIEAIGKLMWKGRGSRRRMGQLGIAFSAVNAGDQEAISQFVEERLPAETAAQAGTPEPVTVG
ncbi:MAG: PilZ domain-containing protein, partial [Candidatus Omnitrophica bacterium]|nr:PilZ domain-containing protein [Candidatus Omnitrophota bacterium]